MSKEFISPVFALSALLIAVSHPIDANAQRGGGGDPPPPQPTTQVPTLSTTGSYTISWSGDTSAPYVTLEESANGEVFTSVGGIAAGSTSTTLSSRISGFYDYRVKVCSSTSGCSPYSEVKGITVVTQIGPTAQDIADEHYVALKGDANGDGRLDFYITKPALSGGIVSDYYLIQQDNYKFSVIASMGSDMDYIAPRWPASKLEIYREDLSFDGYMDFIVANVGAEIAEGFDLFVYTIRNEGRTATASVAIDSKLERTFREVQFSLAEAPIFREAFDGYRCTSDGGTFTTAFFSCPTLGRVDTFSSVTDQTSGGETTCSATFRQPEVRDQCVLKSDSFVPEMIAYYDVFRPFIVQGAGQCDSCIDSNIALGAGLVTVSVPAVIGQTDKARRAAAIARAAMILAGILVADDVTVVGALDDVLIPAVILIAWIAIEVVEHEESVPTPTTDAYARTSSCRPQDPEHISGVGNTPNTGSPNKLKKNVLDAGCSCPNGSAGHHIVQKGGGNTSGAFSTFRADNRAILEGCGVDIDDAVNGVCLPASQDVKEQSGTNAVLHSGDGIHGAAYNRELFRILNDSNTTGGCNKVTEVLKNIGDNLARGQKFW